MTSCDRMCCHSCNGFPGAIFQQDNARTHTARVSQDCLHTVTTLCWLARSPDLSLIKQIWINLGRRVGHSTSVNELRARLQQKWNEMSQEQIQNSYASMPDRIKSCICAKRGSTGSSKAIADLAKKAVQKAATAILEAFAKLVPGVIENQINKLKEKKAPKSN
ncbi:transposable element Tcb1 transposase [Trichonephila clavipes]|nr:transposable element Tcb1 transposase [Trichonephila clavipes]